MNFRGAFSNSQEKDSRMTALWVPVTPEKTTSVSQVDKHATVVRGPNWLVPANRNADMQEMLNYNNAVPNFNPLCQAVQNGGHSNYTRNVDDSHILNPVVMQQMFHYANQVQNLESLGHPIQNREHSNSNGGLTLKSKMINHIAGSFSQALMADDTRLNNNSLEFLLMNNGVHSGYASNESIMPATCRQLNCQEINSTKDYYANNLSLNSQYHLGMDQPYDSLEGLVSSGISLNGSLFSMDNQCSVSNPRSSSEIVSEIPQYQYPRSFETRCNPNLPRTDTVTGSRTPDSIQMENVAGSSITNSIQMASVAINQAMLLSEGPNFQSTVGQPQQNSLYEDLIILKENETHKYRSELRLKFADSSSSLLSTPQKGEVQERICYGTENHQGFDLNQTPEKKAPKRKKHRPKVIIEGKTKKARKNETARREVNENTPKKRKYVRKSVPKEPNPQADFTKESATAPTPHCRRSLNFDSEKAIHQSQNNAVSQMETQRISDKDSTHLVSEYMEFCSGENIKLATNQEFRCNQKNGLLMKGQQAKTSGQTQIFYENLIGESVLVGQAVAATTEKSLVQNSTQSYRSLNKETDIRWENRGKNCVQIQQNTSAKKTGNSGQIHAEIQKHHTIKEVMAQNNRMPVGKILPTAYEGMNYEKEYCHTNYKHVPTVNTLNTSFLHQEIIEVDENDRILNKNLSRSIEQIEKGFHTDICGIKSWQASEGKIVPKDISDSNAEEFEMLRCYHERNRDANNMTVITEKPPSAKKPPCRRQDVHSPGVHLSKETQIIGSMIAIQDASGRDTILAKQDISIYNQRLKAKKGAPEEAYCAAIDELIFRLENLNLGIQNAIVPYKGDHSIVPFQGSDLVKKHKLRAKVALDEETERVWKMLMANEGSDGDKEKDKWWDEERRVLRGRADSFIARMHLVQGDRRFSPWKGSVVDSIVGVFLTQNVSDHLSSSAFMSLAARFPCKSRACNNLHTKIVSKKPEVCLEDVDSTVTSCRTMSRQRTCNETFVRTNCTLEHWKGEVLGNGIGLLSPRSPGTEEEILSSQDSLDSSIIQGSIDIRSCTGSNSDIEDPTNEPKPDNTSTGTNIRQVDKTTVFHEFYSSVCGQSVFEDRTNSRQRHVEHIGENVIPNSRESLSCYSTLNHPNHLDGFQTPVSLPSDYLFSLVDLGESTLHRFEASGFYDACNMDSRCSGINGVGGAADNVKWMENGSLESQPQPMVDKYEYSAEHFHPRGISRVTHVISPRAIHEDHQQCKRIMDPYSESDSAAENVRNSQILLGSKTVNRENFTPNSWCIEDKVAINERIIVTSEQKNMDRRMVEQKSKEKVHSALETYEERDVKVLKAKKAKADREKNTADWDNLRKLVEAKGIKQERSEDAMDSMDYEALRHACVDEISDAIRERGMNNMLAERIKEFLDRVVRDHGSIDLEWLRDVPPDKAKDYLLSIRGLGLKSVECVRLLTLHNVAFPVDTNVGRIAVRLGWVPLQPLPESLQIHLLELYPMLESVQKYLWPRLCKLDQKTLYELHYQLITFGKVFCTKNKPNCNACPMRAECRHFASAFASARLALPAPEEKRIVSSDIPSVPVGNPRINMKVMSLPGYENKLSIETNSRIGICEPIIEEPATPEQDFGEILHSDIEDVYPEDPDEIPTIKLSIEDFATNLQTYMQENTELQDGDLSKALVAFSPQVASIPAPKLKHVSRLRTEHQVYELQDSHPLLEKMDRREPDDPSPYLLAIWGPGETANTVEPPERTCKSPDSNNLCNETTCSYCNSIREANAQTVRGTILIPCRTAMRGSFPLNGTYFQVNEVFADHESSHNPIDVPRGWLWNLAKRTVFFGTSVSTIFKGLTTQDIQQCFWRGFVCVRGFDPRSRAPRPLVRRLHNPASKLAKR